MLTLISIVLNLMSASFTLNRSHFCNILSISVLETLTHIFHILTNFSRFFAWASFLKWVSLTVIILTWMLMMIIWSPSLEWWGWSGWWSDMVRRVEVLVWYSADQGKVDWLRRPQAAPFNETPSHPPPPPPSSSSPSIFVFLENYICCQF